MNKSLLFTALLAATPVALLLPGCSGGALPGNPFATATPRPNATATPIPAISQTSNFTLGNGQRAILKTVRNGASITGTMQILAPLSQNRTSASLTRSIKVGTFSITGVFTAPRGFNFTVKDGNETLFTMIGLFPTTTQAGSYSITTFDGQTDSGVLPISGGPTATATPRPSATPTSPPTGNVAVNLTFTPSSDSNFVQPGQLKGNAVFQLDRLAGFGVGSLNPNANGSLIFAVVTDVRAGSVIDLASDPFRLAGFLNQFANNSQNIFSARSGTITLTQLTATRATFTFKDALYAGTSPNARGNVTINGTVSAPLTP